MTTYAVYIHPAEEGGYWAEVPDLPGCVSQGETIDETLHNTVEAIRGFLESLRISGSPVPDTEGRRVELVAV